MRCYCLIRLNKKYENFHFFNFRLQKQNIKTEISELIKTQLLLDSNLNSCKLKLDELTNRDQLLDRQFRTFFSDTVSAAVVDQAYRIFK